MTPLDLNLIDPDRFIGIKLNLHNNAVSCQIQLYFPSCFLRRIKIYDKFGSNSFSSLCRRFVCPLIYGFGISLWHLQTFLKCDNVNDIRCMDRCKLMREKMSGELIKQNLHTTTYDANIIEVKHQQKS